MLSFNMATLVSSMDVLNECGRINGEIDKIRRTEFKELEEIQQQTLDNVGSSSSGTDDDPAACSKRIVTLYRQLTDDVKELKSSPNMRTPNIRTHVERVESSLRKTFHEYLQIESKFYKRTQEQLARQYSFVRPNASNEEIQAAVRDASNQIFSQAIMQSNHQPHAANILSAVKGRREALREIERQIKELLWIFEDMATQVLDQEASVIQIEQKSEETVQNLDKGVEETGAAINTARKSRRRKWICLGICVAIIVVILISVLTYIFISRSPTKR